MHLSSRVLCVLSLTVLGLTACSSVKTDSTYTDREKEKRYEHGSLVNDKGGFSLLGGGSPNAASENVTGIGVNGFLWRASLDTISFMPIASADPFGGIITTDWYAGSSDERTKLNVLIMDRDLRADGVKVTVFRQVRTPSGQWQDAPVNATTAITLEETILTRARQLRLSQKDAK